jgi:hypothetical protein
MMIPRMRQRTFVARSIAVVVSAGVAPRVRFLVAFKN